MADAEAVTANNEQLHVVFAFNHGGRGDIARAARRAAALVADGQLRPDQIDEALVGSLMGIPGMPDADLIVRSSGEHRISNFLLWQVRPTPSWYFPTFCGPTTAPRSWSIRWWSTKVVCAVSGLPKRRPFP